MKVFVSLVAILADITEHYRLCLLMRTFFLTWGSLGVDIADWHLPQ